MRILLVTPPFTQLNTPYPATAYLKAFLESRGHDADQLDLGIGVFRKMYSPDFLNRVFDKAEAMNPAKSRNPAFLRMTVLRNEYVKAAEIAVSFLSGKAAEWTQEICFGNILPRGHRFEAALEHGADISRTFGEYGLADTAKYAATLTVEEIADMINWTISSRYGFSRYASSLAQSPGSFDEIHSSLMEPENEIETAMFGILDTAVKEKSPDYVGFSVPFPGNLYAALACGKHIRTGAGIPVVMGGGYVNTELRELSDPRFFDYCDYLCFDDGELPLLGILEGGPMIRTKCRPSRPDNEQAAVESRGMESGENPCQSGLAPPDYDGLGFSSYISVLDTPSPMHRLWNEQSWLKYTLAHGCYWKKCAFCDTSLDYIGRYEAKPVKKIADDLESMILKTGRRGFHFVDEAAPPALLKELSLEILRRRINITWWTNIRFERSFSRGLTGLLAAAGCTGAAGGIETAHPRLLEKINKGVSIPDLAVTLRNFRDSGILCHGYLMYDFPSQTLEETADSLETVRQLFKARLLSSAYWHRFNLTAHSGAGLDPQRFGIRITGPEFNGFARNSLSYSLETPSAPGWVGDGLALSLEAYMRGTGLETDITAWFGGKLPCAGIAPDYVESILDSAGGSEPKTLLWTSPPPVRRPGGPEGRYLFFTPEETAEMDVPAYLVPALQCITGTSAAYSPVPLDGVPGIESLIGSPLYGDLLSLGMLEL